MSQAPPTAATLSEWRFPSAECSAETVLASRLIGSRRCIHIIKVTSSRSRAWRYLRRRLESRTRYLCSVFMLAPIREVAIYLCVHTMIGMQRAAFDPTCSVDFMTRFFMSLTSPGCAPDFWIHTESAGYTVIVFHDLIGWSFQSSHPAESTGASSTGWPSSLLRSVPVSRRSCREG